MPGTRIGIFRDHEGTECWLEVTAMEMLERVLDAVRIVGGDQPDHKVYLIDVPRPGTIAHHVGDVRVEPVDDADLYTVQALGAGAADNPATLDVVGVADLRRTPRGEPGEWIAQAVIFDKTSFDYAGAVQWIAQAGGGYRDFGAEDTPTHYTFPQYSPAHFAYFKQVAVAPGVSVLYGQLTRAEQPLESTTAQIKAAADRYATVHSVNRGIAAHGLRVAQRRVVKATDTTDNTSDVEERYILGIVLEPTLRKDADGNDLLVPDTQGDVYTAEEVRKAAHLWLSHYGQVDLMHSWRPLRQEQVQVLESYLAPVDFDIDGASVIKGTWLLALRVLDDALWEAVKAGALGAYSIGGTANSDPLTPPAAEEPAAKEQT